MLLLHCRASETCQFQVDVKLFRSGPGKILWGRGHKVYYFLVWFGSGAKDNGTFWGWGAKKPCPAGLYCVVLLVTGRMATLTSLL